MAAHKMQKCNLSKERRTFMTMLEKIIIETKISSKLWPKCNKHLHN